MFFKKRNNITTLNSNELLNAILSNEAYTQPERRRPYINEYILDPEFNKTNFCGYYSPSTENAIFVIRGTANMKDVGVDILLILQQITQSRILEKSGRFQELQRNFLNFHDKYKRLGYTIGITGHSLGGFESIKMEQRHDEKIDSGVVFNAGAVPLQRDKIPEDITHIRNPRDIVSLGWANDPRTYNYTNKQKISLFNPLKNHTIEYFL